MNKQNIKRLIEVLEKENLTYIDEPVYFDMTTWLGRHRDDCGTVACIAGHATILSGKDLTSDEYPTTPDAIWDIAQGWLGLDVNQASSLFAPQSEDTDIDMMVNITVADAIATLERFLETGRIIWRLEVSE